jgi:hypothetical protein
MGLKLPGPQPVEVFGGPNIWQVREIASPRRQVYTKLGRFVSLEHAKREVADHFARQLEPWQPWAARPNDCGVEIMLTPYEVADLGEGKFGWIQDEDRTHIIHAPTISPGAKIPPAACGASVNAKCFIDNRANIEPSCRACKEIWEREYKGK